MLDWLIDLARRTGHRFMVRLVKGAYWDSEIKRAQVDGQSGYPVYTRKVYTDVAYLACAQKLLAAPDAIYPQFATHNAYTLAAVHELGRRQRDYEFQCLHGMGETLYDEVVAPRTTLDRACRIYAPVGTHETLLAYLVRRLLENGANSSFVNRMVDPAVSVDELVADPGRDGASARRRRALRADPAAARRSTAPSAPNSQGIDLAERARPALARATALAARRPLDRRPDPAPATPRTTPATALPVRNPADHADRVGTVREATHDEVDAALACADAARAGLGRDRGRRARRVPRARRRPHGGGDAAS